MEETIAMGVIILALLIVLVIFIGSVFCGVVLTGLYYGLVKGAVYLFYLFDRLCGVHSSARPRRG